MAITYYLEEEKMRAETYLHFLGKKVKDKVTGIEGVVTSVSFDLYGCIQILVNPGLDKDNNPGEVRWYDSNRLIVSDDARVMEPVKLSEWNGPAALPIP